MKCSQVRNRLMAYVEGGLPSHELLTVRSHLAECGSCLTELEPARRAFDLLRGLREEEPAPDLLSSVRQRIASEQTERRPVLSPRLAMAFSILAIGALIAAGWFWHRPAMQGNPPVVRKQEMQSPAPKPQVIVEKPVVEPQPVTVPQPSPEKHRVRKPSVLVKQAPKSMPALEEVVADETDSGEPEMLFVLQPREPESYMIAVGAEEESPASEISVVREFNTGGEVTSVTIDQKEMPDVPDSDAPDSGATRLLDTMPVDEIETGSVDLGGYTENA